MSNVPEAPAPLLHHETIHLATERLQEVNYHLGHLLRKITGDTAEVTHDGPSSPIRSLKEVLECGAGDINDRINEAHAQIDSIESLLF